MKRSNPVTCVAAIICILAIASGVRAQSLWDLANQNKEALRIATLFTAQDVRDRLSTDKGIDEAIDWCKKTGVTHAFIESFRDGYTAERPALEHARDRFRAAGFDVSGCVTTTKVGKDSTGWKSIACYTDEPTQKHLQEIFEYTASMFDEIMIDDFWFTDCQCDECQKARGDKSWAEYPLRPDDASQPGPDSRSPPRRSIPRSRSSSSIPSGTISSTIAATRWCGRRPTSTAPGSARRPATTPTSGGAGKSSTKAYFIMRWLGGIGGAKCGGGWFDPFGTHEATYVEQARQTVLADAKEMLLFCYGSLLRDTGPANVEKLRTEVPGLFAAGQAGAEPAAPGDRRPEAAEQRRLRRAVRLRLRRHARPAAGADERDSDRCESGLPAGARA